MKVLITGSKGFIGRNLIEVLQEIPEIVILPFDKDDNITLLSKYARSCDFVFHLAAVHRPVDHSEFDSVNRLFFEDLLFMLQINKNACPVLLTSSIHSGTDTDYGRSKLAAEKALREHSEKMKSRAIIYRLTNTFGKYALPNHHSVVATFCYNIVNELEVTVSNTEKVMQLYYIDDVIKSFLNKMYNTEEPNVDGYYYLPRNQMYSVTLRELLDTLFELNQLYKESRAPELKDEFKIKLYHTFLYYRLNQKVLQ